MERCNAGGITSDARGYQVARCARVRSADDPACLRYFLDPLSGVTSDGKITLSGRARLR